MQHYCIYNVHFNMKILFQFWISLSIILVFITSCGKDSDTVKPTMFLNEFNYRPQKAEICGTIEDDVITISEGEVLTFKASFSDDQALSQYKIDIHNNFDCHGHSSGATPSVVFPNVKGKTQDWIIQSVNDISGVSFTKVIELKVPDNVTAGNYHFSIQLIDESGNESENQKIFSLRVYNKNDKTPPVISVSNPAISQIDVKKGGTIKFSGVVTDNLSLNKGGNGIIFLSYLNAGTGNVFATDTYKIFDESDDKTSSFEWEYTVPQTLAAGVYFYYITAFDGLRNVSLPAKFQLNVK